jgi:CheY-like chemotaxis protein
MNEFAGMADSRIATRQEGTETKILAVDDEPCIRKFLQTLLEVDGFDVEAVRSGEEALTKINNGGRPDVIILNVLMPEMNGLEALGELMRLDRSLNVIMHSCSNELSTIAEALRLGARDYLAIFYEKAKLDEALLRATQRKQDSDEDLPSSLQVALVSFLLFGFLISRLRASLFPMKSLSHPVVAAFDATTPTRTRFAIDILSAIQPVIVSGALHGVCAGLVDRVGVVRNSHEHVVSVGGVISDATSYVTAMVRGSAPGINPRAARFVLHYVVVTRAKRSQVAAQNICSSSHKNPLKTMTCSTILGGSLYGSSSTAAPRSGAQL